GRPDERREDDERRQVADRDSAEHAFLEAIVELEDPVREREGDDDPAAEVAEREQEPREDHDRRNTQGADELDLGWQAAPEAPEPGEQAQNRDDEQVEDALDEHGV